MSLRTSAESTSASASSRFGLGGGRELVLGHRERRRRGAARLSGRVATHASKAGPNSVAEAVPVEVCQLGLVLRVRVDPRDEGRDVDLGLASREVGGAGGLDPRLVHAARRFRLLAVPARRLVAAPGGRDRGEASSTAAAISTQSRPVGVGHVTRTALARRTAARPPYRRRRAPRRSGRSVRSIAVGRNPPTPSLNGIVENVIRSSMAAITDATDPISSACVTARSPRSAKKSMKTKITHEMRPSTTQSGVGMTPTAPWMRSARALSRSKVWSSHLSWAVSSLDVCGWNG